MAGENARSEGTWLASERDVPPRREGLRLPDREAAAAPVSLLAAFQVGNERCCGGAVQWPGP